MKDLSKDKKGLMALNSIIEISLFVIGFLVILGVIYALMNTGTKAGQEAVCRDSVMLRSKANIDLLGGLIDRKHVTPLVCEPIDAGELKGTREDIKYQISELAAKCWWMYAEGQIDNIFNAGRKERSCGVCYYFTVPKNMDKGMLSNPPYYFNEFHPDVRDSNLISLREMYNYMTSTTYNPKLLYGGGTKNYVGDVYEPKPKKDFVVIENTRVINIHDVKEIPLNYLQDYSRLIEPETEQKILDLGTKLRVETKSNLLVVVADEFRMNDRSDSRRLIESLKLNSEKDIYDAVLLTISLTGNPSVRLHLGNTHSSKINEYEINRLIETRFANIVPDASGKSFNDALRLLIGDIEEKLTSSSKSGVDKIINPNSFYSYLSNDLETIVYVDDIESEKTYVIMYSSPSDKLGFFEGIRKNYGDGAVVAVGVIVAVAVVAAIVLTAGTAAAPIAASSSGIVVGGFGAGLTGASLAGAGGTTASFATVAAALGTKGAIIAGTTVGVSTSLGASEVFDTDLVNGMRALAGATRSGDKKNNIIITRAQFDTLMCSDIE